MFDVQGIATVVTGVASGVSVGVTKMRLARSAASDFAAAKGWISRTREEHSSMRDAKRLLGFHNGDITIYRSDNVHPLYRQPAAVHPDNRRALLASVGEDYLIADSLGMVELQTRVDAQLDDNLVLIGSPTSEGISRLVFGYTLAPSADDSLILDTVPIDLPYRMILDLDNVPSTALARRTIISIAGTHGVGTRTLGILLRAAAKVFLLFRLGYERCLMRGRGAARPSVAAAGSGI